MNKYLLFLLLPIILSADDIIVHKSSLSQYQIDNCVQFDLVDFDDQDIYNPY